jgi:hypothetical protein
MTTFDERQKGEEHKFRHSEELRFKVRNRRNRLFGLWVAETHLGLTGEAAADYAKDVVMADFELPGDDDMLNKVKADLAKAGHQLSDHQLSRQLSEMEAVAKAQVLAE